MNRQKIATIAASSGIMITVTMFLVFANAHIDIFPCTETVRERSQADMWTNEAPLVTRSGTCSLMDHLRDDELGGGEKSELTGAGWGLLISICLGIGIADAGFLYTLLTKLKREQPDQA